MKRMMKIFVGVAVTLSLTTAAWALPLDNSGEFMFTIKGNDPSSESQDQSGLEAQIEDWFLNEKNLEKDIELDFYAKVDAPGSETTEGSGSLGLDYVGQDAGEAKWGRWEATEAIDFYSVKAGNGYALYWVDSALSGTWNTEDRQNKGISHLSTWRIADAGSSSITPPEASAVPEPSTVLLLAAGLVAVVGLKRKRMTR